MVAGSSRRTSALVLLAIVLLNLVLISDHITPSEAMLKKKILKKLKKVIPLLALLKPKKKVILLPLPIPIPMKKMQWPMDPWSGGGGGFGGGGFGGMGGGMGGGWD